MAPQVTLLPRIFPALVGIAAAVWLPGMSPAQTEDPVFRALPVEPIPRYTTEAYPAAPRAIPVAPTREREGGGLFGRRKDKDRDGLWKRPPGGAATDTATVYPLERDVIRTAPPGMPGAPVPGLDPAAPAVPQDPGYQPRPTGSYVPGQPMPQAPGVYPGAPSPAPDPYAPREGSVVPAAPAVPGMTREVPPVAPVLEAPPASAPVLPNLTPAPDPTAPAAPPSAFQTPPVGPAMPPSDAPIFRRDPVSAPPIETVMVPAPPTLGPEYPTPVIPEAPAPAEAPRGPMAPIFRTSPPAPAATSGLGGTAAPQNPASPPGGGALAGVGTGGMPPSAPASSTPPASTAPPAPPKADDPFAHLPFAKPVPGKVGFVTLSDYDGEIDVRGIAPGTPVEIPHPADETKTIQFRVP